MVLEYLLQPFSIGGCVLKNRVVSLPLYTGYAYPDGRVSPLMLEHYGEIARSGAALVVVGNVAVSAGGATAACNLRAHGDEFIAGLSRLAAAIKRGGALAALQLNHGGPFAKNGRPLVPSPVSGITLAHDISSLRAFMETFPVRERFGLTRQLMEMAYHWQEGMSRQDREQVIADFADAAHRAWQAGFDIVELHGGTGYLIAAFLSGYTNRIGSLGQRAGFPLEVMKAVKARLPEGFPVGFRLMLREWVPGGIDLEDAEAFARMLDKAGAAYLSVTAGSYTSMFKPDVLRTMARPAYLGADTASVRQAVDCPVIIAGRVFSPRVAETVLKKGQADLVGLARPLLADSKWLKKARSNEKIRICINCNACLKRVVLDAGIACVRWPGAERERIDLETAIHSMNLCRELVAIAGIRDMEVIRSNWELRIPEGEDLQVRFFFLKPRKTDVAFDEAISGFLEWAERFLKNRGFPADKPDHVVRRPDPSPEDAVMAEGEKGDFGVILVAANPGEPWRKRIAARHKTGVVSFVGSHPDPRRVIMAVDLSTVSLLLLRAINHVYYRKPGFDFTFVHVADENAAGIGGRWREILDILGWDPDTPLKRIPAGESTAGDLLDEIRSGNYGTVILGRRKLTTVRRWIMGSVSGGVLEGLTDQGVIIVG